jgi:hypothetical protein
MSSQKLFLASIFLVALVGLAWCQFAFEEADGAMDDDDLFSRAIPSRREDQQTGNQQPSSNGGQQNPNNGSDAQQGGQKPPPAEEKCEWGKVCYEVQNLHKKSIRRLCFVQDKMCGGQGGKGRCVGLLVGKCDCSACLTGFMCKLLAYYV